MNCFDKKENFISLKEFLNKHDIKIRVILEKSEVILEKSEIVSKKFEIVLEQNSQENIYFCDSDFLSENFSLSGQEKCQRVCHIKFRLQLGAKLNFNFKITGLNIVKFIFEFVFEGQDSSAKINGSYFGDKVNIETVQRHLVKNTSSQLYLNGALYDNSTLVYRGKIFVAREASGVKAEQKNKNIVLGENIFVDAAPELEILNNDVECKHGCAVGQFDKKQIFYLQSRGLDYSQATKLMLEGFLFGLII